MIGRLRRAVANRGPGEIAALAIKNIVHAVRSQTPAARAAAERDGAFDRTWGTQTSGTRDLSTLGVRADRARHAVRYEPSPVERLHTLLDALEIEYARYRFVDYGAGKGRIVLAASQRPFAEAIGVEFASELCTIAEDNVRRFNARNGAVAPIRIVHADAGEWPPPADPFVAYLYNPFGAPVMRELVANIEASLAAQPRDVRVLYLDPRHLDVWEASGRWRIERDGARALLRPAH